MNVDRQRAYLRAAAGALVVFCVAALAVALVYIIRTAGQIESCVNPDGECARRGQEQTAEVVGQLVDAIEHGDPAARAAIFELCDAYRLDCADLRVPTEGN